MNRFLDPYYKILKLLVKIEISISVLILLVMVLISTIEIFGRNIFKFSITWANSLVLLLYVWFIFLGICYIYYKSDYICVSFFTERLPMKVQMIIQLIINILITIFFIIVLMYIPKLISLQLQRHLVLPVRRYLFTVPLIIPGITIILIGIRNIVKIVIEIRSKKIKIEGEG